LVELATVEAESSLASLLERVEEGEEIVITRGGKPVARLVPDSGDIRRGEAAAASARIRARAAECNIKFDWEEIKRDRDEGRP
jgi:prevent-host-death family protein